MNIAALSQPLSAARFKEFRILPAGLFRAQDGSGRPQGVAGWIMNADIARRIIASLAARDDVMIDYEHASLGATERGTPAPAAGWFKQVEWREGDGLYATDARWTAKAAAMIADHEYRFISPVFSFDGKTGEVGSLFNIGLTNNPALSGLTDLAAATAATLHESDTPHAIEAFNRAFEGLGVYHPATPNAELVRLQAACKRASPAAAGSLAGIDANDAQKLRQLFPGVFS